MARRICIGLLVALACSGVATAQDARGLAAGCSACHGTNGAAVAGNRALAGMPARELAGAMREYRSGQRDSTVMPQLARGYNDAEIDAMAAWFAAQKPPR